jgi:hypothetical protein
VPKYRLNYGDQFEFFAQTPAEVVPVMQVRRYGPLSFGIESERLFMRRSAMEMCEWNGKDYYFHDRDALAGSMIKNGLLEVID